MSESSEPFQSHARGFGKLSRGYVIRVIGAAKTPIR